MTALLKLTSILRIKSTKNFSATLELGYVFVDQSNLDFGQEEQDDIFRSALTFVYKF